MWVENCDWNFLKLGETVRKCSCLQQTRWCEKGAYSLMSSLIMILSKEADETENRYFETFNVI